LIDAVAARLAMDAAHVSLAFDRSRETDRRLLADLYRHGRVVRHENDDDRVSVEAEIPRRLLGRFLRTMGTV
jgi:50S ribosomal subunit-associated GTPase HflX